MAIRSVLGLCSLLLLTGDDLGLGSTLDLLSLALELLGQLARLPLNSLDNFVLLKKYKFKIRKQKEKRRKRAILNNQVPERSI